MIHVFIILAHAAVFGGATVRPSSLTYRNIGLDNKLFTENVVFESAVTNDMQCARLCSQHDDCQSFTFTSTVCRGHSLLVTSNPSSSVDAAGAQTFDENECASGPCQNGGSCVDQVNGYTCNCQAGYTGIRCETDVDECASGPCYYGGSCVDQVNAYTCNCPAGYAGTRCETDVNECASGPCQNGASCVDQVNGYTCYCPAGYAGTRCQTDVDECASGPCQNGGSCVNQVNAYTCNCQAGYAGTRCETDVDECASGPCQNGGSCVDQVNGYTCNCPFGYTGIRCETDAGLYKTCTTDNDCSATNMDCFSGQCLCGDRYFFSNSQFVCVQTCSHYVGSYLNYTDWDLDGPVADSLQTTNADTCASACNQHANCVAAVLFRGDCYIKEVTTDFRQKNGADVYIKTCA